MSKPERLSRRDWLKLGAVGVAGVSGARVLDLAARGGASGALVAAGVPAGGSGSGTGRHGSHPQQASSSFGVVGDTRPEGDGHRVARKAGSRTRPWWRRGGPRSTELSLWAVNTESIGGVFIV